LDFYFGTLAKDETVEVPDGYKLIGDHRGSYLVRAEPDLTEKDVADIELREYKVSREEGEIPLHVVVLHLAESAGEVYEQLIRRNIGNHLLVVLNGEILAAPIIGPSMPSGDIRLTCSRLPQREQKALLSRSKSAEPKGKGPQRTSSLDRPPEIVPGTATITINARFADGTRPTRGECLITPYLEARPGAQGSQKKRVYPAVRGEKGDWIIYNVGEGRWRALVREGDFAFVAASNWRVIEVKAGEEKLVNFTLVQGGSVSGRVVRADTENPVSGVLVVDKTWKQRSVTDAQGYYTINHVAPGPAAVRARAEGFAAGRSEEVEVKDEATTMVPDIKLHRGGWIPVRVPRPQDAPEDVRICVRITPHLQDQPPPGTVLYQAHHHIFSGKEEVTFHMWPLPPGSYTLETRLIAAGVQRVWGGEVEGIRVEDGKVTKEVTIEVSRLDWD